MISSHRLVSAAFRLWALLVLVLPQSACVLAAVGAAGAGGYTMGNERGIGGTATDTGIKTEINARWVKADSRIGSYIDLNIFEGRVLLTGSVPDPKIRDEAVAEAWRANGVKEVINEIQVAQASSFSSAASDNWILARLNSDLLLDGEVRTPNYSLQCVDGTLYVLGVARTQVELDHVLDHARNIPNVRQVKNFVRIRSGVGEESAPVPTGGAASPSALSPPGATGPTDSRDPALGPVPPRYPIQTQPLN